MEYEARMMSGSSEESGREQSVISKSSANELLSLTSAAVEALNKPKTQPQCVDLESKSKETNFFEVVDKYHPLSPTGNNENTSPEQCDKEDKDGNNSRTSSLNSANSKSTTASEVLLKSTSQDLSDHNRSLSLQNASISSRASSGSHSSTLLTGQAIRVKVQPNKLKQIDNPFGDLGDVNTSRKVSKDHISQRQDRSKSNLIKAKQSKDQVNENKNNHINMENAGINKDDARASKSPLGERDPSESTQGSNIKTIGRSSMLDSGYQTQKVQVVLASSSNGGTFNGIQSSSNGGMESNEDPGIVNVVAKNNFSSSEGATDESSCSQPEIVTVHEKIVTVRAADVNSQNGLSSGMSSDSSLSVDNVPSKLLHLHQRDRFSKYHPGSLKQGTLVSEGSSGTDSRRDSSELTVSQYCLDDKKKFLKDRFVKRQLHHTAKRKVVQPKYVHQDVAARKPEGEQQTPSVTEAATTAAVAAASAVAATQPFLKAQQDMEMRIASLIEKIGNIEAIPPPPPPRAVTNDIASDGTSARLRELEAQLASMTSKRLDYLESMQKHQVDLQTQLLEATKQQKAAPVFYPDSRNYGRHAPFTKEYVSQEEKPLVRFSKSEPALHSGEKSMLDTPAPRRKPPTPTSYVTRTDGHIASHTPEKPVQRGQGLLAEILASQDETPQDFPDSPHSAYTRTTPRPHIVRGKDDTIHKAKNLVDDLGVLSNQLKDAVHDHTPVRPVVYKPDHNKPAPLDHYLAKVKDVPPTSPYPTFKEYKAGQADVVRGNAPILSKYADAEDVLKQAQASRMYLEANLDNILRSRHETEIFSVLEQLTRDSSAAERLRVQNMVDKHIKSMNSELQREIMDELLKLEENKKQNISFLIPERDTGSKLGSRAKGGVNLRDNAGLQRGKAPAVKQTNKVNLAPKRGKKPSSRPSGGDKFLDRIYGKALYQNQRSTQKEPYLRLRSSPVAKLPRPVTRPAEIASGTVVATAKTQTGVKPNVKITPSAQQFYFDPNGRGQHFPGQAGFTKGQLIPMAIPLGAPRKEGGPVPPQPPKGFSPGPAMTSTPVSEPQRPKVTMVTIKDEMHGQSEGDRVIIEKTQTQQAREQTPSPVDSQLEKVISDQPVVPEARDLPASVSSQQTPYLDESEDLTITTDSEEAHISLPGHQAQYQAEYHGPVFPPAAPTLQDKPSSDVMAADIRQRDLLHNKAYDWVEQELMAQLISEVYSKRAAQQDILQHPAPSTSRQPDLPLAEMSEDNSDVSGHDSLIAETLGNNGMQFFVDVGLPVDEKLVNALLKEVIIEKIKAVTAGQRTALDDEKMKHIATTPKPRVPPQESAKVQEVVTEVESAHVIPEYQVETPLPTPRQSPVGSPSRSPIPTRRQVPEFSPLPTPEVTPAVSIIDDQREPPHYSTDYESEEESTHAETQPQEVEEGEIESRHNVSTPDPTPPATPPALGRTPSPSLVEPTPEPSVHEEPPVQPPPREVLVTVVPKEESPPPTPPPVPVPVQVQEKPEAVSIGVEVNPESLELPKPEEEIPESEVSSETPKESSQISDTINEHISDGQWLLSLKSDGEVQSIGIDPDLREKFRQRLLAGTNQRLAERQVSQDDTLMDTEEIEPDQDGTDVEASEGEFLHRGQHMPDKEAVLAVMSQLERVTPKIQVPIGMPISRHDLTEGVDKSLGEVSIGQRPALDNRINRQINGDRPSTSRGRKIERIPSQGEVTSPGEMDEENEAVRFLDIQKDMSDGEDRVPAKPRTPQVSWGITPGALTSERGRRSPGNMGPVMPTDMPRGGRGRMKAGIVGPRPRVIQVGRSLSPEPGRGSSGRPGERQDTGTSRDSLHGTVSDFETRTMTPDQMNVEALLQSRDYFTNTQSDMASTTDAGQPTGEFNQTGPTNFSFTGGSREFAMPSQGTLDSRGYTTSQLPGLTPTLETTGETRDEKLNFTIESDSDLRISGRYADSLEGSGEFVGPMDSTGVSGQGTMDRRETFVSGLRQVSVTIPSMQDDEESLSPDSVQDVSEFTF